MERCLREASAITGVLLEPCLWVGHFWDSSDAEFPRPSSFLPPFPRRVGRPAVGRSLGDAPKTIPLIKYLWRRRRREVGQVTFE